MKYRIGFIGAGVMASTIIERMLVSKQFQPSALCAYDISSERKQWLAEKEIYTPNDIQELVDISDIVVLAVKPQSYTQILVGVDTAKISNLVSIMAGVKIGSLKSKIANSEVGIARIMPNTPAAIGKGITAVCFDNMDKDCADYIKDILSTCGEIIELAEDKFDAFTCICGSGPAYAYMILDAMVKAGVRGGLSLQEAKKMAVATLKGSASFALNSDTSLDELVKKVCSKGGTTIEAIKVFEQKGLVDIIIEGIDACRKRSIVLSESN